MRHGFCHFAFYKDQSKIPEMYFQRLGKEKPASSVQAEKR
jgi:hypothetical protein